MAVMLTQAAHLYQIESNENDGVHFKNPRLDTAGFDGAFIIHSGGVKYPALILPPIPDRMKYAGKFGASNAIVLNRPELDSYVDHWLALPNEFYDDYFQRTTGKSLPYTIERVYRYPAGSAIS